MTDFMNNNNLSINKISIYFFLYSIIIIYIYNIYIILYNKIEGRKKQFSISPDV